MPVNADKPHLWKSDIAKSVDYYNNWFIKFAPATYKDTRQKTIKDVQVAFELTNYLTDVTPKILMQNPSILPILRMATAPPIARDRLIGLAQVSPNLVKKIELHNRIPPRMGKDDLNNELNRIIKIITKLIDSEILTWLADKKTPDEKEMYRAASIIADRHCGAISDPIIRNAQERRQLSKIEKWLRKEKYTLVKSGMGIKFNEMVSGTFAFRLNVPVLLNYGAKRIHIPVDIAIKTHSSQQDDLPIFIEAKSAGDFTNTNKRRKEEATKINQLKETYGEKVIFILFLNGYFDSGYLGYEAAEGIDWIWEHRIQDFKKIGI